MTDDKEIMMVRQWIKFLKICHNIKKKKKQKKGLNQETVLAETEW